MCQLLSTLQVNPMCPFGNLSKQPFVGMVIFSPFKAYQKTNPGPLRGSGATRLHTFSSCFFWIPNPLPLTANMPLPYPLVCSLYDNNLTIFNPFNISKKIYSWLVVEPTHLKKYARQIGSISPNFRGKNSKKSLKLAPTGCTTNDFAREKSETKIFQAPRELHHLSRRRRTSSSHFENAMVKVQPSLGQTWDNKTTPGLGE